MAAATAMTRRRRTKKKGLNQVERQKKEKEGAPEIFILILSSLVLVTATPACGGSPSVTVMLRVGRQLPQALLRSALTGRTRTCQRRGARLLACQRACHVLS